MPVSGLPLPSADAEEQGERINIIEINELQAVSGQAKPVGWAKQAPIRMVLRSCLVKSNP